MKLAKRQARAKSKKQKYNQQKALKAQQIAANKSKVKPAVPSAKPVDKPSPTPVVDKQTNRQSEQTKSERKKQVIAKNTDAMSPDATALQAIEFSLKHPIETIAAIDKAVAKDEFTPTLLGKLFDVGAAKINTLLETLGFQAAKEAGKARALTPTGEAYIAKAKAAGFTWKYSVVEQLAALEELNLDQDLVNQQYRSAALTTQ